MSARDASIQARIVDLLQNLQQRFGLSQSLHCARLGPKAAPEAAVTGNFAERLGAFETAMAGRRGSPSSA